MSASLRYAAGVVAGKCEAAVRPVQQFVATGLRGAGLRAAGMRAVPGPGDAPPSALPADRASLGEVHATLLEYAMRTRQELGRYLPAKEPSRYLYELLGTSFVSGGKGLRPAICIATCRAFGGRTEQALQAAAAFELLHAAFLVHDDIEDGSPQRRGRPALHEVAGIPLAINAGDALAFLSLDALFEVVSSRRKRRGLRILAEFQDVARETLEGQAIELGWIRDNVERTTFAEYLVMTLKKTTWYTVIGPCHVGALLGSRRSVDMNRFLSFGFYLGAMFQIIDDLRNLTDSATGSGEVPKGDIREGKRTLMLIHLLLTPKDQADERELTRLLERTHLRTDADVDRIYGLMEQYGSIDVARACARDMAEAAAAAFGEAFGDLPPSPDKRFLAGLTPYLYAQAMDY